MIEYIYGWMDQYSIVYYLKCVLNNKNNVPPPSSISSKGEDVMAAFAAAAMRRGGCGAKVGASTLSQVLSILRPSTFSCILRETAYRRTKDIHTSANASNRAWWRSSYSHWKRRCRRWNDDTKPCDKKWRHWFRKASLIVLKELSWHAISVFSSMITFHRSKWYRYNFPVIFSKPDEDL